MPRKKDMMLKNRRTTKKRDATDTYNEVIFGLRRPDSVVID